MSPHGTVQARDGGLLEEVQREEEAERSHLDHHACLEELLKYVAFIVNLNNIYYLTSGLEVRLFSIFVILLIHQHKLTNPNIAEMISYIN